MSKCNVVKRCAADGMESWSERTTKSLISNIVQTSREHELPAHMYCAYDCRHCTPLEEPTRYSTLW